MAYGIVGVKATGHTVVESCSDPMTGGETPYSIDRGFVPILHYTARHAVKEHSDYRYGYLHQLKRDSERFNNGLFSVLLVAVLPAASSSMSASYLVVRMSAQLAY
jgi:hypothetical protein